MKICASVERLRFQNSNGNSNSISARWATSSHRTQEAVNRTPAFCECATDTMVERDISIIQRLAD
eukprot:6211437-Pleurochrysis_carterae.AAC.2